MNAGPKYERTKCDRSGRKKENAEPAGIKISQ
jgi:hypothetical protein